MRKILYIFAAFSLFATVTCYAQGDSCLKLLGPAFAEDTTWENPDSVMVDSCVTSPTFGQKFAKGWFNLRFTYYILPTLVGPEDTIIKRTWQDIDTQYALTRTKFDSMEQKYGPYHFVKFQPNVQDTASNIFDIQFTRYVNIDSATNFLQDVLYVEEPVYIMRAGRELASVNEGISGYNFLSIHPNPTNNYFTLVSSDKSMTGLVSVRIFDHRGVVVASESVDISLENKINVSSLASGVYQVYCDDAKVGSMVIQR